VSHRQLQNIQFQAPKYGRDQAVSLTGIKDAVHNMAIRHTACPIDQKMHCQHRWNATIQHFRPIAPNSCAPLQSIQPEPAASTGIRLYRHASR